MPQASTRRIKAGGDSIAEVTGTLREPNIIIVTIF